jgi:hypothetical protein
MVIMHGGVSGRDKELTRGGKPEEKGGGTEEDVEDSRKDPGRTFICLYYFSILRSVLLRACFHS